MAEWVAMSRVSCPWNKGNSRRPELGLAASASAAKGCWRTGLIEPEPPRRAAERNGGEAATGEGHPPSRPGAGRSGPSTAGDRTASRAGGRHNLWRRRAYAAKLFELLVVEGGGEGTGGTEKRGAICLLGGRHGGAATLAQWGGLVSRYTAGERDAHREWPMEPTHLRFDSDAPGPAGSESRSRSCHSQVNR
jgi:hypothetical protein